MWNMLFSALSKGAIGFFLDLKYRAVAQLCNLPGPAIHDVSFVWELGCSYSMFDKKE